MRSQKRLNNNIIGPSREFPTPVALDPAYYKGSIIYCDDGFMRYSDGTQWLLFQSQLTQDVWVSDVDLLAEANKTLQFYRDTSANIDGYTGLVGSISIDTETGIVRVHDGSTQGGQVTLTGLDTVQELTNKTISLETNTITGIDGDGLEIVNNLLDVDDTVVRTFGSQNITGLKKFNDALEIDDTGGIISTQNSFNLLNADVETINFAGGANVLNIGDTVGTTTINNDLVVQGDFTVGGTVVTTQEENLIIEDKTITLANAGVPTNTSANQAGIVIKGTTDKTLLWLSSTSAFTASEHLNLASGKEYRINNTPVLTSSSLGDNIVNSSLTSVGTITTGAWQGDVITKDYGGTGYDFYEDGDLLVGRTSGNTLIRAKLTEGAGIDVTNGSGSITIANTDRGSSQNIFKNIANDAGVTQFSADSNNESLRFAGDGATQIAFDSTTNKITISTSAIEYSAGDGLELTTEDVFNVDNTVVRTSGQQTISDTKTFSSTIDGSISGNAATATALQTARTINGISFDGTSDITIPTNAVPNALTAGDGLFSDGVYDGSTARTFSNADKGSSQNIFKRIANENGTVQITASSNDDALRLAPGGDLSITFEPDNTIRFTATSPEQVLYTAGDGLNLNALEFEVDSSVVRTSGNQNISGTKTFIDPLVLSTQASSGTHAVRADRSVSAGDGLAGGGNLTSDIALDVDSTVIRTTGNQLMSGTKTFSNAIIANGGLQVNDSITSVQGTVNFINSGTTTLNIGGDATAISIGAATGTTTINNDLSIASASAYKINGVDVLTSDTLGSGVVNSSLTSLGIIETGTWEGDVISSAYGGTGLSVSSFSNGQLLVGNSSTGGLSVATLTAGDGVTITNGNGSIEISAVGEDYVFGNGISYQAATSTISVDAGDGLIQEAGGLALGTPSTLTNSTTNNVTASGHTHEIEFPVTSVNGQTGDITIDADPANFAGDGLTTSTVNGDTVLDVDTTVVRTTGNQTVAGVKTFTSDVRIDSLGVGVGASGVTGEIRATSDITAYYSSDRRLKENVREIDSALDKISKISGVTFDWTDEEIERRGGEDGLFVRKNTVGVIAQEIEEILPEVVGTREDGHKAVRYELIVPLLIQAIKEQQEMINRLVSNQES